MPVPVSVTDSLRTRPPEASNRSQFHVPHDPAAPATEPLGVDCVEPVDGQLAQALQVGCIFAAEALEQERGVCHGELMPAVRTRGVPTRSISALSGHIYHPAT